MITPGDWADAEAKRKGEQQQAWSKHQMAMFDEAPLDVRRVWDAVSALDLALTLHAQGVRDFDTAERAKRLILAANTRSF